MADMSRFSRVEARWVFGNRNLAIYGREWEVMQGSEGFDADTAAVWTAECLAADKSDAGNPVYEYRFVDGEHINHEAWLAEEQRLGMQITANYFVNLCEAGHIPAAA